MKLAIVKGQKDLLRVIPMIKDSMIEFKITLFFGEYSLEYWEQAKLHPLNYISNSEITYHGSRVTNEKVLPGTVHIKEIEASQINYTYKFTKVADEEQVPSEYEYLSC